MSFASLKVSNVKQSTFVRNEKKHLLFLNTYLSYELKFLDDVRCFV